MVNVKERISELSEKWEKENPNATEKERKMALEKITAQVVHELMQGK